MRKDLPICAIQCCVNNRFGGNCIDANYDSCEYRIMMENRQQYDEGYKDGLEEAKYIKDKYDALVRYLEKYDLLGEAVCDAMSDLYEGDKPYCEVYCGLSEPNAACIDRLAEMLVICGVK